MGRPSKYSPQQKLDAVLAVMSKGKTVSSSVPGAGGVRDLGSPAGGKWCCRNGAGLVRAGGSTGPGAGVGGPPEPVPPQVRPSPKASARR